MNPCARVFLASPVGWLRVEATERGLAAIEFMSGGPPAEAAGGRTLTDREADARSLSRAVQGPLEVTASQGPARDIVEAAVAQLEAYFARRATRFDLPLDLRGTPFQLEVWEALRGVPWGTTVSYGELARRIGRPGASRAVGAANGANPIPIVIPCHRVITSRGRLGGYSSGLERKRILLALEGVTLE